MRRSWMVVLVAATLVAVTTVLPANLLGDVGAGAAREAVPGPPNIVLVLVDDMRDDELRFMPSTRRLIGQRGVRFVNSFSPYPLCCPARASILSGKLTHNHRVFSVDRPYAFHSFDDRRTVATVLRGAGYATIYLGKYLNRYGIDPPPRRTTGNSLRYVPPGWSNWRASIDMGLPKGHPADGGTYRYFDTTLSRNGRGFQSLAGRYQTAVYGEITERIIRRRSESTAPWFLHLSFTAAHYGLPHEPDDPRRTLLPSGRRRDWKTPARPDWVKGRFDDRVRQAPGADWKDPDSTDKPPYLRSRKPLIRAEKRALLEVARQRAEALAVVDLQVRRLIRTLEATGQLDNTVVVFTSDNGYFLGEQHIRQGKVLPHEPSLRVPLLMRGPGIPAGQLRHDPFTSVDFLPTFAAAAGVPAPAGIDGVSLWEVARTGDSGWTRAILTETDGYGHRPRDTGEDGLPLSPGERPDIRFLIGLRTARYLYVDVARQKDELYDVLRDPQQYHNLIGRRAYADIAALLATELAQLRACRGSACLRPLPSVLATGPGGRPA